MTSPDQLPTRAYGDASVLLPENLLCEARRQKGLTEEPVPAVCVLDPDGDIVEHSRLSGAGRLHPGWACYHTEMWVTQVDGLELGVVGRAIRDEGTSLHYLPPTTWAHLQPHLLEGMKAWDESIGPLASSAAWTTDAPYRETAAART